MPKDKDFKRLVRARMDKTGESYTAARARLRPGPGQDPGGAGAAHRDRPGGAATRTGQSTSATGRAGPPCSRPGRACTPP